MMRGYGQVQIPGVDGQLPPLPGYVTEQQHTAAIAESEDKRKSYVAAAITGGLFLGFMFGRLTKVM